MIFSVTNQNRVLTISTASSNCYLFPFICNSIFTTTCLLDIHLSLLWLGCSLVGFVVFCFCFTIFFVLQSKVGKRNWCLSRRYGWRLRPSPSQAQEKSQGGVFLWVKFLIYNQLLHRICRALDLLWFKCNRSSLIADAILTCLIIFIDNIVNFLLEN